MNDSKVGYLEVRGFISGKIGRDPDEAGDIDLVSAGVMDSLALVSILADVEKEFGVFPDLMQHDPADLTSLNGLANVIFRDLGGSETPETSMSGIDSESELESVHGLTPLQQGMLLQQISQGNSELEMIQGVIRIEERLDESALARAWTNVMERHPVLRSSFEWRDADQPKQRVHQHVEAEFSWIDLSDREESQHETLLLEAIELERQRGFDLAVPPLTRLQAFKFAPDSFALVWSFHHIVADGWSISIVLSDLLRIHHSNLAGEESRELCDSTMAFEQHIDKIANRRPWSNQRFFDSLFSGIDSPSIIDAAPPAYPIEQTGIGSLKATATISRQDTKSLRCFAKENGFSMSVLFHAAWGLLLGRYIGEPKVLFSAIRNGRSLSPGSQGTVGCFIDLFLVKVSAVPENTVRTVLEEIRGDQLAAFLHEAKTNESYPSLLKLHQLSGFPQGSQLSNSVVVYDKLSFHEQLIQKDRAWEDRSIDFYERPPIDITVRVEDGVDLKVTLISPLGRSSTNFLNLLLHQLQVLLVQIPERAESGVGDFMA